MTPEEKDLAERAIYNYEIKGWSPSVPELEALFKAARFGLQVLKNRAKERI